MTNDNDDNLFAKEGHDEGFGPVCLYKGNESKVFKSEEELIAAQQDGWKESPGEAKKAEDEKTVSSPTQKDTSEHEFKTKTRKARE